MNTLGINELPKGVRIVFPRQRSIHDVSGMGLQFIPWVGQEVLVQFLGGDIDRPLITGALYDS